MALQVLLVIPGEVLHLFAGLLELVLLEFGAVAHPRLNVGDPHHDICSFPFSFNRWVVDRSSSSEIHDSALVFTVFR